MSVKLTLSGRHMAITGAGRGLGRALAIIAADHGANLTLLGRQEPALCTVADIIKSRTGRGSAAIPCDLARPDSIRAACATVLAAHPILDVLVNNGAPWLPGSLSDFSDAAIEEAITATVTGTILITKGLLPALKRSQAADIVTVVSTSGLIGTDPGGASAVFHAAKHGQSGFSDALRHELKEDGIRVTALYPPDFADVDPLSETWATHAKLCNRDIVAAILGAITAPRHVTTPMITFDH